MTYRYRESYIFLVVSEPVSDQIGTGKKSRYRYRKNLVLGKSPGTGIGKIWYRKKVSGRVSENFDTGTDFCCQNLGILKIFNGYRYRYREFFIFLVVSEPVSAKFVTGKKSRNRYRYKLVSEKILGTGIGKI